MKNQSILEYGNSSELSATVVNSVQTPALLYDEKKLQDILHLVLACQRQSGCKLLYAVKASSISSVLHYLAPWLNGFAASSLFEARFVRSLFPDISIHFTTPGIRREEIEELSNICSHVSLNSRYQVEKYGATFAQSASVGIRVNTRISMVGDERYDPCRPNSKLGIPIEDVSAVLTSVPFAIEGLHIHTNADSTDFDELLANVNALLEAVPSSFTPKWINFGGGYLFEDIPTDSLIQAVRLVKRRLGSEVYLEPGAGLVRSAGYLVASVLDIIDVDGSRIAVLDSTINHMPEVLEFNYKPDVVGQNDNGPYKYILAGSTCLAGDIFGAFGFAEPLQIGSKILFEEAGAYTLAKAHRFNGMNLPEIGVIELDGQYRTLKNFTYHDFIRFWTTHV